MDDCQENCTAEQHEVKFQDPKPLSKVVLLTYLLAMPVALFLTMMAERWWVSLIFVWVATPIALFTRIVLVPQPRASRTHAENARV